MDDTEMHPATGATAEPGAAPSPVAETMRRVQAQLAGGSLPSFEALLAFGMPGDA